MRGKVGGKVVTVNLDINEVHGQGKLVGVKHPVLEIWHQTLASFWVYFKLQFLVCDYVVSCC